MVEATEATLKYWAWDKLKTTPADISRVFTVVQWNTLNSELSDLAAFPKVDEKHSSWIYREKLMEKFLTTIPADFFCLEEVNPKTVESYTKVFDSINRKVKYYPKKSGFCGVLVAFNDEQWKLTEEQKYHYKEANGKEMTQVAANLLFKNAKTDDYVHLIATHLKAKHEFEEVRYAQTQQLVELIKKTKKEVKGKYNTEPKTVLAGDLNAEPDWKSVKEITEKSGLTSAFSDAVLTTFKIRDKEQCRVIDYIFHDPTLKVISRNAIPTKEDFGVNGLPNEFFPSDHFFLVAQFEY